jgi:flavin reductase (DIM6/NTAB) family NADH-FMN oxidoreductase RutF
MAPPTGIAKLTPKAAAVEEAERALRQVMGRFATGVTVVTTTDRDVIHGMTANAFLSVSLRPPLVLVSLGRCRMSEMLPRAGRYGVSVLAHDQENFAAHFAAQGVSPVEPAFVWHHGLPLLEGALAHIACRVVDVHPAGDHVLWIGEVEHLYHREGEPLLFYTGRFGTLREVGERAERERGSA